MPTLTLQQVAALSAHDRSVSLAAGAGCGKTFVLTERFLTHLDPASGAPLLQLDELVAITFTEAAAREMRDRIRQKCRARMHAAPPEARGEWRRLIRELDGARISTIHSFCARLLRRHAVEAGVDPQFEVLDAASAQLLQLEVVDDCLRTLLEQRDETLLDMAARRGLAWVRDTLARLASQTTRAQLTHWQTATAANLQELWQQAYQREAPGLLLDELRSSDAVAALRRAMADGSPVSDRLVAHLALLSDTLRAVDAGEGDPLALAEDLNDLARVRGSKQGSPISAKDWSDPADHAAFRDAADAVRKSLEKLKKLDAPPEHSLAAAEAGLQLVRLAAHIRTALDDAKRQRNQLDFDDLMERAHELLTAPGHESLRQELAGETRLLMVDEFQDTDPMQVAIVQALCGDDWQARGLFVVGDDKQSIYRFRGAEPDVSHQLRNDLPEAGRLSLTQNFRSQPAILDFVNATFWQEFRDYEPLTPSRPQATPEPAIEFLWPPFADEEDGLAAANIASGRPAGGVHEARQREARWIARRIAQLVDSGEPLLPETEKNDAADNDNGSAALRPVRLGDVAILLRALSDVALYEEALRQQGLDYYLAGGHAFYAQQEVYDLLNLLRSVTSQVDEIALAGALRSPLFALADETLYWLVKQHGSLNAALAGPPLAQLDEREAGKLRRAAATLAELRERKDQLLVAELLDLALAMTGYDAVLQGEFLGSRKLANLDKLREQARTLDRTSPGDVDGFVTQLAEFVARAPKEPPAATQAEGDVVRIMTIHSAKGLEFPVVVLPDLDRAGRSGELHATVHRDLGPLLPGENRQHGLGWQLYQALEQRQDRSERLRLFYVACTRAADMLLISGPRKNPEKPQSEAMKLLARRYDVATGAYAGEPLPAALPMPRIRVLDAEPAPQRIPAGTTKRADLVALPAACESLVGKKSPRLRLPALARPLVRDLSGRQRFSFSQLSGELQRAVAEPNEDDAGVSSPDADVRAGAPLEGESDGLDPRRFGTLVHDVLERVDFGDPEDAARWCEFLAPLQFPRTPDEAAAAALGMIKPLLTSPRGADLASAVEVRREVEFLLPWPPGRSDTPTAGRRRYLQGFIDCLYCDRAGAWHLLDYKTNRVDAAAVPATAAHYELQLLVYQLACEEALGTPVAEATLLMLAPGVPHSFAWNPQQRAAALARVTAAMDALCRPADSPE